MCFCPDSATATTHGPAGGWASVSTTVRISARLVKCRLSAAKTALGLLAGSTLSVRATMDHMRIWSIPLPVQAQAHASHTRSERARRCLGSVKDLFSSHFFAGAVASQWRAHIAQVPGVSLTPRVGRWGRPASSHTITGAVT